MGKNALSAKTIFLKNEHKHFSLVKEQRTQVLDTQDYALALKAIGEYLKTTYALDGDTAKNKTRLGAAGFVFSQNIERTTFSGKEMVISDLKTNNLNKIKFRVCEANSGSNRKVAANTHTHGCEFHNRVGIIGLEVALETVSEKPFFIPQSTLFTYDAAAKIQSECKKNVYTGYLSSAEVRSASEKLFERFYENSPAVDWWYKNGDKGDEFFSIVYVDNSSHQKLFYPDYIVSVRGEIWICETKGGFDRTGASEDIDIFSPKKCEVLQKYLARHKLHGGFVRQDKASMELLICTGAYSDDVTSDVNRTHTISIRRTDLFIK